MKLFEICCKFLSQSKISNSRQTLSHNRRDLGCVILQVVMLRVITPLMKFNFINKIRIYKCKDVKLT